ncbi:hypothetical protein N7468_009856 [Penicillium chermesinum]|uniref:F-box domain-containing protein n=1 Tax=Penicillium chermesinum TaxID=63820 RepID=A0A9W9NDH1_9EURO|nr:uncharacterized protein N7468_009856 [Penicillium chermesinum]KAJ5216848.1 hypothetical protein N7468_009856 [Penicillium chermesinum]
MPAAPGLASLPFDIFYEIATLLDDRDYVNLSRTSRHIHETMKSDLLAKKPLEVGVTSSSEGQSALTAQTGYRSAVGHRFDIHEAVATAAPYSACALAYGTDFLYNQGFLCYHVGHEIRLLDVHSAGHQERVLDLNNILPGLHAGSADGDASGRVELLRFADGIVVFRVMGLGSQDDTLLAIDMTQRAQIKLLLQRAVPASASMFVRHSRSYLWYGVCNGTWSIFGVDIASPSEPIHCSLDWPADGDLGQSLCFEIYRDHLYAVSTLSTSDSNERLSSSYRDEAERCSSFYYWSCHAPRNSRRKWSGRLWRREHCEGPINEMWTDLSIRTDERTGQPVILECRREWPGGKSENHRTYYTQQLPCPSTADEHDGEDITPATLDLDDSTASHGPYNERPSKRLRRHYHPEHEPSHGPGGAKNSSLHAQNTAPSTFVDLVNDPVPPTAGVRTQDRLRLRAVSRKRKCPIDEEGIDGPAGLLFKPTQQNLDGTPVEHSEERFISGGAHMWPAEDAPSELTRLLCPGMRITGVNAIADERSLIYSIQCPGLPEGHKVLILISFDPKIHFSTMTPLGASKSPLLPNQVFPVQVPRPTSTDGSMIRESQPLYEIIRWGYRQ